MKKVAGITLAISIALGMTTAVPVKADSEDHVNSYTDNVEIVKAFTVMDGKITPISIKEYNQLEQASKSSLVEANNELNSINTPSSVSKNVYGFIGGLPQKGDSFSPNATIVSKGYVYKELNHNANAPRKDLNRRISAVVHNTTTQTATRTISYSASQNYTSSISLTSAEIKAIGTSASAGASWSQSQSGDDSITQSIPKGKYAWMDFYPIMTYSYGTLTTNTYNITDTGSTTLISSVSKNLNIYGPKKQQTTKLPDGVYTVKESTTLPNY